MKRCLCFLLMLAAVILAGPREISALMAADRAGAEAPALTTAQGTDEESAPRQVDDDQLAPKQRDSERNILGERKSRRGIGADFWGGPYWGYGPRWGHPCEACRATCESDREGSRCERCRVRCGW
jgi:hypothetical protein